MPTSRLPTPWTLILDVPAGALILAFFGVLTMSVVAQDEDEEVAPTATYVTGQIIQTQGTGDFEIWEEDGVGHVRGMWNEQEIEWSDPRLPTRLLINTNLDEHQPSAGFSASSYRLEGGVDGAWVGTGHSFYGYPDEESLMAGVELMTLTGEGAYEGLSAMIASAWMEGTPAFEGFIYEGELPPVPDPVESNPSPLE